MQICSQFITETHNDNKSPFPYTSSKTVNIYESCKKTGLPGANILTWTMDSLYRLDLAHSHRLPSEVLHQSVY